MVVPTQAEAHLECGLPDHVPTGLNVVNITNLDYFQPNHQAEIFRLKGLLLQVRQGTCAGGCQPVPA